MVIPDQCLGFIILIAIILIGPWVTTYATYIHNVVSVDALYKPEGQFIYEPFLIVEFLKSEG